MKKAETNLTRLALLFALMAVLSIPALVSAQTGVSEGSLQGGVITPPPPMGFAIKKIPMAIPLFFDESGGDSGDLARELADIITDDMEMSGEFDVIDRVRYLEDPRTAGVKLGSFAMQDWSILGVEYLVKGSFLQSNGKLKLEMRLFNVNTKQMVTGKEYSGTLDDRFKMVHMFSNDIFLSLFGERGFFGSRILFTSGSGGQFEIYIMDIDGRNRRKVTNMGIHILTPRWSPDGKKIVFSAIGDAIDPTIYILDVATEKVTKVISNPEGVAITPRFSPSGKRIVAALTKNKDDPDIFEMGLDGSDLKNLTNNWAIDMYPVYSPNGKSMLMISDRPGTPQVYRMNADGTDPVRISFYGAYNQAPSWSPKGDKIAYAAREYAHYTIYVIDDNGGEPYALTSDMKPSCEYPTFSPDGRALLFSCETPTGRALWLRTAKDTYTKQITKGTATETNPDWGPMPED